VGDGGDCGGGEGGAGDVGLVEGRERGRRGGDMKYGLMRHFPGISAVRSYVMNFCYFVSFSEYYDAGGLREGITCLGTESD